MIAESGTPAPAPSVSSVALQLDDIQSGALRPRPSPYAGTYLLLRIDDRQAGRALLGRLLPLLGSAADTAGSTTETTGPAGHAWLTVALSFQGLKALGVPDESLATFPEAFRQGMAARAALLGDAGDSDPSRWEAPLGSSDVHLALAALAPDAASLADLMAQVMAQVTVEVEGARRSPAGVEVIWRQDVYALPNDRTSFGFKDGISHPAVEGSGIPGTNPHEAPIKAGEFVLGYPDETGDLPPMPSPDVLGRNGSFVVFRKLQTRVAAFRQYIRANAKTPAEEELLAAKFVGRWRSGAPLVLTPDQDDPELGADPALNNAFNYRQEDPRGLRCPFGAHARRMNARDSIVTGEVRLHRMIRRGTSYGPMLPDGTPKDDGADRGIVFAFVGAHLERQFEFVKREWMNKGTFFGAPAEMDPLVGPNDGSGQFTVPRQPIRRRLQNLPAFVVNRGGEYCFMPSLSALRWLADLDM
jgi:Dyp-type peroxidase family